MATNRGLGRGLQSLFDDYEEEYEKNFGVTKE